MATFQSFEVILERQCDKLRDLQTATILIKNKDVVKNELVHMRAKILHMSDGIKAVRKTLNDMREQNNHCQELLSLINNLHEKNIHMEENVPSTLISNYQMDSLKHVHKEDFLRVPNNRELFKSPIIDCKKILFNEPEVYPIIPLITKDEFGTIPKYIIGRQSLDSINSLIDAINQVLKRKYTLLSLGKANARKQGDLSLYLHYKKQELDICSKNEYVYFFTKEDYEEQTKCKLNKIKLNLLTVLRHCKRLREHRIKNDLRYVVLPK
ncbi:spindle and kinetochore-associated protein 1-like [Colletes gigas]|uniref:spindle and kinetochore-associated protein 1-like n=1 Tax=Colletes gigas TaxID=935657 RepID=UPI001C9B03FB|nr:spindle and kinetochore-associated protein 1-like [Colletes gigas]